MLSKLPFKAGLMAIALFSSLQLLAVDDLKLNSSTLVKTHTKEELKKKFKENHVPSFIIKVKYTVDVYEILYKTQLPDGTPVTASGLYFVPKGVKGNIPVVIYHHGTQVEKHRDAGVLHGEQAISTGYSCSGYAVIMPDYIGLGKGEGLHIYQHYESEAQASIDMIRAVREFNKEQNINLSDELFITGYSQGGHAAMSLHKFIEEKYPTEFKVKASSPMSGAYDMAGVQSEVMFKPYAYQGYLPYLLFSYNRVYKMYDNVNTVFKSPFDTLLMPLYDGTHGMGDANRIMPPIPKDVIKDTVVEQYVKDENFPFRKYLAENSVANWKPNAPVQMCYCEGDQQVNYRNALVAEANMKKLGAKNVRAFRVGKKQGHVTCAMFAAIHTKMYFDSFLKGSKKGRKGPLFKRWMLNIAKKKVPSQD
jgi:S-formylglutathione hydrolase FrmB